ncbi:hypothetical protein E0Z10_g6806 [Xylaria hypoxylon]|uniref:CFEM domain-containing protein n=1 Tax=Xylaria hypoxylon TaxID=37992 RepID=A0A4Z0YS40_9PEZI|nr:hypothetical protein E0Z10_g6806 [Xylaria hypoxylon]
MKSTTLVLSLFAALAAALTATLTNDELAAKIPPCAQGCLENGYNAFGCSLTDYPCQCDNQHDIFDIAMPCIDVTCTTQKEFELMAAATTWLCGAVAQQQNPEWTGPGMADNLPPILLSP